MFRGLEDDPKLTNRLVIVSVNCDRDPRPGAAYASLNPIRGIQISLGGWAGLPAAYGVPNTGAVLIDPEGLIATRLNRVANLRSNLRRILDGKDGNRR